MTFLLGLLLTIVSGTLNGSFAVPTKKIHKWEWENTWLIYAFLGMIVFPLLITLFFIPDLLNIYSNVASSQLWAVLLFGCGWGIGSLLFGLAIRLVGISVGFTVVVGGIAVFGALLPFLVNGEHSVFSNEGLFIMMSLVSTIIGVTFCGVASKLRTNEQKPSSASAPTGANFKAGILISVLAALLSSMLNLAFYFGAPVAEAAQQYLQGRSTPFLVNHSIWVIALFAGFFPYMLYCMFLMIRKRTFANYKSNNTQVNLLYAGLMALLWFSCIILYGIGSEKLGTAGASLGWLVLMAVTVIVGNIWGFVTKEWKGTSSKAKNLMFAGILFLVVNILIIGLPKILGWY
jgi:L-rhamnose-H+ transport protein